MQPIETQTKHKSILNDLSVLTSDPTESEEKTHRVSSSGILIESIPWSGYNIGNDAKWRFENGT